MLDWLKHPFTGGTLPVAKLCKLQGATNAALGAAREVREQIGGPVNWCAVICWQAETYQSEDGMRGTRVWISGASPDACDLHKYVRAALCDSGWGSVEVVTEW